MTILVCDDDKEIVEAIEIYLMQEGYDVEKAYDGIQAVEIMKNKPLFGNVTDLIPMKHITMHTAFTDFMTAMPRIITHIPSIQQNRFSPVLELIKEIIFKFL